MEPPISSQSGPISKGQWNERELLKTIFEQAPDDAILVMDLQRTLTAWNPAAERITGWAAAEAIGQPADIIFTPEDRAANVPARETNSAARDGKAADERWHVRKDGQRFWGSGTMNALHAADGSVCGFLKVFRDATERHVERETLAFLRGLSDEVLRHPDAEQIIDIVTRRLGEHLGASRVFVAETSDDGQAVTVERSWAAHNMPHLMGSFRLADFGPQIAADYAAGRTHVRRDSEREYGPGPELDNVRAVQALASVDVPVQIDGRLRFIFIVHQSTPRDWTDGELMLIQQVADRTAAEVLRARAARALSESESRLREMADAMPQIVWTARPDGTVDYWNRQWYAYTGLPADGVFGNDSWRSLFSADDGRRIAEKWSESVQSGRPYENQYLLRRADGQMRWTLARAEPVRDADGRVVRWYGTNTEIHDQRLAAEATQQSELRLASALEVANLGTYEWDMATNVVTLDARAREQFGFDAADVVMAADVFARINPADLGRVQAEVEVALQERTRAVIEYDVCLPDGQRRRILSFGNVAVGSDGQLLRMTGVFDDVTDRRRAEAEREQLLAREQSARAEAEFAGRMKDEFLATLSHELRTPLSAILGWSQILGRGTPKPEVIAEGVRTIERNARAQTQIIEDLLDMSRIISGKVALDARSIDAGDVIRAAIETVSATAVAKLIDLRFDAPVSERFPAVGDFNRLQQVFWNLMSNAIKFTPKGGTVSITVSQRHSMWQVDLTDSGEGISAEFVPFVFDRFRQADASTTRKHGGLGLGLSIVKQLVELHGGAIRVTSAGLGKGSTFTVSLPVRILHDATSTLPHATDRPVAPLDPQVGVLAGGPTPDGAQWEPALCDSIRGRRAVIIDDEVDARALLRQLLSDCGMDVIVTATVDEALAAIQRDRPDVLVSDIGMPIVDGYELIRLVRALPADRGGRTPAIALTAYARGEDRVKAVRAGFQTHVPKPVEPAELIAMIGSVIR